MYSRMFRQLAIPNGNVEDPIVLERPLRGLDFPRSDADDQNPVSLRHKFGGALGMSFLSLRSPSEAQPPIPRAAVRSGQRPVLTRNDPLNVFGDQRQQTLLVAAGRVAAKKSFTIWTFFSVLIGISPRPSDRIALDPDRVRSVLDGGYVGFIRRT